MFWQQYKRTLVPIQATIVLACLALFFALHVHPMSVLVLFVAMEVGAVIGAAWGVRLKRKITATPMLPHR